MLILVFFFFLMIRHPPISTLFPYTTLFRSLPRFAWSTPQRQKLKFLPLRRYNLTLNLLSRRSGKRSEERFSRNAETDLVCRLLLEKKNKKHRICHLTWP